MSDMKHILLADPRVRKQRFEEYLRECEPITRERVKLRMMYTQITIGPHGNVEHQFPAHIQAIDDAYVGMIEQLQKLFFGCYGYVAGLTGRGE